jgi:hypothetical protein
VIAVAFPEPAVPGLIIRYSYLWYREHLEGRDEGQKDRPCAIVAALRTDENGDALSGRIAEASNMAGQGGTLIEVKHDDEN